MLSRYPTPEALASLATPSQLLDQRTRAMRVQTDLRYSRRNREQMGDLVRLIDQAMLVQKRAVAELES